MQTSQRVFLVSEAFFAHCGCTDVAILCPALNQTVFVSSVTRRFGPEIALYCALLNLLENM
jgi:hypothetical protein